MVVTLLDTYEVMLLLYLKEHSRVTTTKMAKDIYEPKTRRDLVRCDNNIRARLKNLVNLGLVKKKNDSGRSVYSLSRKNVFFGGGKIYLPMKGKRKVFVDIGDFIAIKTVSGDFYLRQLNPVDESGVKK